MAIQAMVELMQVPMLRVTNNNRLPHSNQRMTRAPTATIRALTLSQLLLLQPPHSTLSLMTTAKAPRPLLPPMVRAPLRVATASPAATANPLPPAMDRAAVPAAAAMTSLVVMEAALSPLVAMEEAAAVVVVVHRATAVTETQTPPPAMGESGVGAGMEVVAVVPTMTDLVEVVAVEVVVAIMVAAEAEVAMEDMEVVVAVAAVETMAEAAGVVVVSTNMVVTAAVVVVVVVVMVRVTVVVVAAAATVGERTWRSSKIPSLCRAWERTAMRTAWCSTLAALESSRRTNVQASQKYGSTKTRTRAYLKERLQSPLMTLKQLKLPSTGLMARTLTAPSSR